MVFMNEIIDIDLPYNFQTREYQKPFFDAMKTKKRAILVWARRNGKDKTCWNYLIMQAAQKVGVYNYYAPSYKQGKKIIWENIDKNGFKTLNHIPKDLIFGKPNDTELKVRLRNGSIIQIIGTDNPDALVGSNPAGCVFTEASLQKPEVWDLVRPILAENGGWAIFNGTPRGANWFKDLYDMAVRNESWFAQLLTAEDTGFPSKEDIQAERDAGMSEDMIQQEFYCSWTLGVEGAYYAKLLYEAREEDRIGSVPYDRSKKVYTAWDIGYGDSTAICFYQVVGNEIHVIDYYENHGEGLPHYAEVLFRKPYLYADHFAPHDIESHAFSSGLSAKEVGAGLGINFITLPTLKLKIEDGIEAVRSIFPRLYFDEIKCKQLIKCLENYRKEFDEDHQIYRTRPLHNWASHGADSFRYLAIAVKRHVDSARSGITNEEADKLYNLYNPIFK